MASSSEASRGSGRAYSVPQSPAPGETHFLLLTFEVPAGVWHGAGTWAQTGTSRTFKIQILAGGGGGLGEVLILKPRGQSPLGVEKVKFTLSYTLDKLRSNFTHTGLHTLDSIGNPKVAPKSLPWLKTPELYFF